ncbi:uncharacterized protein LOC120010250 [Tripterygium wilfordii]|uniref:uncharacterized protein LOC120010250 n=1 Tax=Tripterygium wilfordii TaxID=458696 RepID=UPI0018F83F23|nr:uncharacterized protein LOC120010250 [Tripterygium wilfordii]
MYVLLQRVSSTNKGKRALYKFNHRLSRRGYVGLMKDVCSETGASEDLVDRSELWKRARRMKNGGYDPETADIINKIVSNLNIVLYINVVKYDCFLFYVTGEAEKGG